MRRSVWLRFATCLWALWFGVVLVEPVALLQSCPMHGAQHGGHGVQMPASTSPDVSHHGAPSHGTNGPCTCLGACCSAPAVALPLRGVAELPALRISADGQRAHRPTSTRLQVAFPYVLPFANGPPARLA